MLPAFTYAVFPNAVALVTERFHDPEPAIDAVTALVNRPCLGVDYVIGAVQVVLWPFLPLATAHGPDI